MNWTELTGATTTSGSISRWLNNSQISSGAGGDADLILQEGVGWIQGKLRHWRMIPNPVTGTMTIGNDYISLPSDFYEPNIFYITGTQFQKMTMKTPQEVIASWSYTGTGARVPQQPVIYYFDQNSLRFDSPADQAYPTALVYYQQIPVLSSGQQTNFLTQYYPRLVRCACMRDAAEWAKDSGTGAYDRTYWAEMADEQLQNAQADSDRAARATEFSAVLVGGNNVGYPWYGTGD